MSDDTKEAVLGDILGVLEKMEDEHDELEDDLDKLQERVERKHDEIEDVLERLFLKLGGDPSDLPELDEGEEEEDEG